MEGKARANGVGTRASPRVWEGGIVHIVLLDGCAGLCSSLARGVRSYLPIPIYLYLTLTVVFGHIRIRVDKTASGANNRHFSPQILNTAYLNDVIRTSNHLNFKFDRETRILLRRSTSRSSFPQPRTSPPHPRVERSHKITRRRFTTQ